MLPFKILGSLFVKRNAFAIKISLEFLGNGDLKKTSSFDIFTGVYLNIKSKYIVDMLL